MDVLSPSGDTRHKGWYLALMAPNVKGPTFAWLDPSRLYCSSQVFQKKKKKQTTRLCPVSLTMQAACVYTNCTLVVLLRWTQALADCTGDLLAPFLNDTIDLVAGIDAMGFILGIISHLKKKTP